MNIGVDLPDRFEQICRLIEDGEESSQVFNSIARFSHQLPEVSAAAIFLPSDKLNGRQIIFAAAGNVDNLISEDEYEEERNDKFVVLDGNSTYHISTDGKTYFFYIIQLGSALGSLVVHAERSLSEQSIDVMRRLSFFVGTVYEHQRLSSTVTHFLERLQVLNELNQMIVANTGLERIVKSISRESAFRFASDISLTFLFDNDGNCLEGKGGYGCSPTAIPNKIQLGGGPLLEQVLRSGGQISIPNLQQTPNHGLTFLTEMGIKAIDACCLEVRDEALGVILIGYRRETSISKAIMSRFEEFSRAAGVAIANARNQERIKAYTERLEELVESRTADLAIQTAKAEEANRAKSAFLANMSHELRTPLTAIVGYSSVLNAGIFGEINEKQSEAISSITRSSEHLKNLIDDVLSLARIESGKEDPQPVALKLADMLKHTYRLMQQSALDKGVTLEPLDVEQIENVDVYVDQKHLQQILINLIGNSIKYTPNQGKVWISCELFQHTIKIIISDTGVGIPADKLAVLFERFERGKDSYSRSQQGTGIGLNLTKRLVELNSGNIGVESEAGVGSNFWITIPLATEDKIIAESHDVTQSEAIRLDGIKVLVVDDSPDTKQVLSIILTYAGAEVAKASSVQEAMAACEERSFNLILTDLAMPGESGLSLIAKLKRSGSKVPVVVLSACAFEQDRDAALNAGASTFIAKPFKPRDILTCVKNLAHKG